MLTETQSRLNLLRINPTRTLHQAYAYLAAHPMTVILSHINHKPTQPEIYFTSTWILPYINLQPALHQPSSLPYINFKPALHQLQACLTSTSDLPYISLELILQKNIALYSPKRPKDAGPRLSATACASGKASISAAFWGNFSAARAGFRDEGQGLWPFAKTR